LTGYTAFQEPALVRALSHPLRTRILNELYENRASPTELADRFDAPLANVAYHVRVLLDLKLIRLVKKAQRRGAIEHYYEAVSGFEVDDNAWSTTPAIVKHKMLAGVLEDVGRQVTEAVGTGGFDHEDAHLTRTRLVLDEQGWAKLSERMREMLEYAAELQTESRERLQKSDHEGERRSTAVMMLFESSPAVPEPDAAKTAGRKSSSNSTRAKAGAGRSKRR
jgi:DNA-binding transcriptional ArsR family regulator